MKSQKQYSESLLLPFSQSTLPKNVSGAETPKQHANRLANVLEDTAAGEFSIQKIRFLIKIPAKTILRRGVENTIAQYTARKML